MSIQCKKDLLQSQGQWNKAIKFWELNAWGCEVAVSNHKMGPIEKYGITWLRIYWLICKSK